MTDILNGSLAPMVSGLLSNLYLPATLHHRTLTKQSGGDLSTAERNYPCRAQLDRATYSMRQDASFVQGDVRLIVLAHGLPDLTADCELTLNGVRYQLFDPQPDAARTHWRSRGRRK